MTTRLLTSRICTRYGHFALWLKSMLTRDEGAASPCSIFVLFMLPSNLSIREEWPNGLGVVLIVLTWAGIDAVSGRCLRSLPGTDMSTRPTAGTDHEYDRV